MKVRIYQLKDIENCDYAFRPYKQDKYKFEDYDCVYECERDAVTLDDIWEEFNYRRPEDFTHHSLSESDLVEIAGDRYYCDSIGWQKV